ncbi:hypothetical protein [Shewanella schlegeliana]|uniref:hypothetical protein n=1 Tax=Shewanella schlegeliana TaxID=190308 RepID=UPI0035714A9F
MTWITPSHNKQDRNAVDVAKHLMYGAVYLSRINSTFHNIRLKALNYRRSYYAGSLLKEWLKVSLERLVESRESALSGFDKKTS